MKAGTTTMNVQWVYLIFFPGLLLSFLLGCQRPGIGYNQNYAPSQPIPFDHSLHAGDLKMDCLYCHSNAPRGNQSTVPSLNTCMNCHLSVRGRGGAESADVNRMIDSYMNEKPIEWVRVHMLPDFVKFNHKRHVAKNIACQTCHGPIEKMTKVRQHSDLSMGWCVECHRKPEMGASLNCTTCHQ